MNGTRRTEVNVEVNGTMNNKARSRITLTAFAAGADAECLPGLYTAECDGTDSTQCDPHSAIHTHTFASNN